LTTRPIDEADQVQLLGNTHQSSDITDSLGADCAHQTQIRDGRRIGRAQNGLSRERPLLAGIPHRLGCDAVSPTTYFELEDVQFFHPAIQDVAVKRNMRR
jgi:hypothetical protein